MSQSIAFQETIRGLYATWRMFLRDPRAASLFENSHAGALRSYWAAAVILPAFILTLGAQYISPDVSRNSFGALAEQSGLLSATLVQFCMYTLCWFVAWPLIVDRLTGYLDCGSHYFRYVAAYNWMHVPYVLVALLFLTGKMSGIIHSGNAFVAGLSLLAVLWTYHWFILRHALGLNAGYAAMLVGLEFVCVNMLKEIIVNTAL